MSDFDERLSAVLTAEADDAPHAAGLAKAARRRQVVRRRRRVAVGGAAAALAIAAPVAVLTGVGDGGNGDELVGNDPSTAPAGQWQTVEEGDVRAEIPGDWRRFTCDFDGFESDVFGPSQEDACGFGTYLAFYGSSTFDPSTGPGVISMGVESDLPTSWGGYVYAGDDWAVSSSTDDRDLTRRILASARVEGQPEVDASEWLTVEGADIRVELPLFWGVGPDVEWWDYAVCGVPGERNDPPEIERERGAGSTYLILAYRDGRWISVAAPTQAVGDLVMASVETTPGSTGIGCVPREFGS